MGVVTELPNVRQNVSLEEQLGRGHRVRVRMNPGQFSQDVYHNPRELRRVAATDRLLPPSNLHGLNDAPNLNLEAQEVIMEAQEVIMEGNDFIEEIVNDESIRNRAYGVFDLPNDNDSEMKKRCRWIQENMEPLHASIMLNLLPEKNDCNPEELHNLKLDYTIRQFELNEATISAIHCSICSKVKLTPGVFMDSAFSCDVR